MTAAVSTWLAMRGQEIVMLAAILAAIGALHRQVVRPIVRTIRRIADTVDIVEAQMRPNGGASLRDAIDHIDRRLQVLEAQMKPSEKPAARKRSVS